MIPALALACCIAVTDGDTIRIGDERVRLLDVDTPELRANRGHTPPACEVALARRATEMLRAKLASARLVVVYPDGRDRYGRTLARVTADGVDLGAWLLRMGVAREYVPGLVGGWCAE